MKAVARLALGWLLMLTGAALLLDGSTAVKARSKVLTAAEVLGGFALVATGVWLRRNATRPDNPR
ncbi:MAG: hypothetical protein EXS35_02255 [Pedosphaera sp.]|nr:hypothetical protein [Pedosphaera sp.]